MPNPLVVVHPRTAARWCGSDAKPAVGGSSQETSQEEKQELAQQRQRMEAERKQKKQEDHEHEQ